MIVLYDDGKHGDGKANDGYYAAIFTATKIPGSYTFRVVASNIKGSQGSTTCEWTKSFYNKIDINPKHSVINFKFLRNSGSYNIYNIKIIPKDRFKNYLGPDHKVQAQIVTPNGTRTYNLSDSNVIGVYSKNLYIRDKDITNNTKINIVIDDKPFTSIDSKRINASR